MLVELLCKCKNYGWGKELPESLSGRFYLENTGNKGTAGPYAEMWVGTHPEGPSVDKDTQRPLSELLPDKTFPVLLKTLSVKTALSIQAHPDARLAEELHRTHPETYTDASNKPEMAVALSDSEMLFGFLSHREIEKNTEKYPQLLGFLGEENTNTAELCKELFGAFLTASKEKIQKETDSLVQTLRNKKELTDTEKWFLKLQQQFPYDSGCFCVFLMNIALLRKDSAVFIDENTPHAYLSGELLECMKTSDNVVRAGLTPKHKDVDVLLNMLSYTEQRPAFVSPFSATASLYIPPKKHFAVGHVVLNNQKSHQIFLPPSGALLVCLGGGGTVEGAGKAIDVRFGSSLFSDTPLTVQALQDNTALYWAFVPSS
ncbi:MAG: mannose-6-phosphate isomerase [Amphiamblys sp. WSBS2006]|nr:MAG: mannose-6-phosphate isomerase [Amphiamblys sp. WSBS2006]